MKHSLLLLFAVFVVCTATFSQSVTTDAASEITYNSAKLNGTLGEGDFTNVIFEYGIDTEYGSSIGSPDISTGTFVQVSQTITDLDFNTTYHYRLSATESAATINGLDVTFTTANINQAENIVFSSLTNESVTLNWTNGQGDNRIVFAKAGSAVDYSPIDATTYDANSSFGSGTEYGTGNYVVYDGSSNTVDVSNLSAATTYHFKIFEYTGTGLTSKYRTDGHDEVSNNPSNTTTLKNSPTNQSSSIVFNETNSNSMSIGWTNGSDGESRICVVYTTESYTLPSDGIEYNANSNFGSGEAIGSGYVVYNGTQNSVSITGLSSNTTYYFRVYDYNNSGTFPLYNTASETNNPLSGTTLGDATWDGSFDTDWNTATNWTPEGTPASGQNVIIPDVTNLPIITGTRSIENLTVEAGASLTINDGGSLSVSGNAAFQTPSNSGATGQLVVYGSGSFSVSGTTTFERYVPSDDVFISSPVSGTSFLTFQGYLGDRFDESEDSIGGWEPLNSTSTMPALEGWFIQRHDASASRTFSISGTFTNGNQSKVLSKTAGSDDAVEGWHLLGNPYPSAIDVNDAGFSVPSGIDEVVYVYDNGTYNTHVKGGSSVGMTSVIPAMQGFWMHANSDGSSLSLSNSCRTNDEDVFSKKPELENDPQVRLKINSANGIGCEALVEFKENFTNNYDEGKEAFYLQGDYVGIYSKSADNFDLTINTLSLESYENESIPIYINLGVFVGIPNVYTIEASQINNIGDGKNVFLYDVFNDTYYNLRKDSPEFELSSSVKSRFKLIITSEALANKEYAFNPEIDLYINDNVLSIKSEGFTNQKGSIFVYDILGRTIASMAIKNEGVHSFIIPMRGTYIVNIVTERYSLSKKILYNK